MVKAIKKTNSVYFECEECGLLYIDKALAERCQKWCSENKSCNMEIIKHAVGEEGGEEKIKS